ncbi:helix-turn-helix domain-containing protein [Clostridium perfringens]|uniref:helix-turn-helix domain-containing protein n=1 Tax=Clostridium perfringens TaxID=1502 RepID=UPI0034E0DDF3
MRINKLINIGDRLKTLRLNKGFTQSQLADAIGIPRTTYANYETNKREPKIEVLQKIATTLGVTIDDILTKNFIQKDKDERLYLLSLKIAELIPFYSFEEIESALELTKNYVDSGQFIISEEKMNKNEEIDLLIGSFSACDYQDEVANILAIKTTYNLSSDLYMKYFEGNVNNEIIKFITESIVLSNDFNNENIAWTCILDTLGFEYAYDIIKNNLYYRRNYISSYLITDKVEDIVWEEFAKMPDRFGNRQKTNNYLSGNISRKFKLNITKEEE